MTADRFVRRVTMKTAIAVAAIALVAIWIVDGSVGLGVAIGGAIVIGNLWWLAAVATSAAKSHVHRARWAIVAAMRFGAIAVLVAVVLASGVAHPIGVVVGLAVLPCALIAQGLQSAREA
jgi:ATP synthase I subunit